MRHNIFAAIIIIATAGLAYASTWNDAPVVDEIPHIGAGYTYVSRRSYQFNPEHPPLAKNLAGLPLLALPIGRAVSDDPKWDRSVNDQWNFGRTLIYHSGADPDRLVRLAKLPMLSFLAMAAWFVFKWACQLYGPTAGLLALSLFMMSPTVLGHGRLVTTDMPALAGAMVATRFFIRWLKSAGRRTFDKNFWLAGAAFGLAQLTKFSLFLLWPYFVLLGFIWGYRNRHAVRTAWRSLLLMAAGFIIVIGPIYQLHLLGYPAIRQRSDAGLLLAGSHSPAKNLIVWASDKPVLRPYAEYGVGMLMVFQRASGGNHTYFMGEVTDGSWKSYFPVVYALKEPLPFLILLLAAVIASLFVKWPKVFRRPECQFEELFLLGWVLFYWTISINANLNIGVRHLLPVYGFTAILVTGQIQKLRVRLLSKFAEVGLLLLIFWYLTGVVSAFPNYLSYFNELARIRPTWTASQAGYFPGGHNYVVDSNLDWGQDLKRLGDWVKENKIQKIYLDYFGWAEQYHYLGDKFVWLRRGQYVDRPQFLRDNPNGGYIAVSATYFQESIVSDKNYAWLADIKPITVIGDSIFVWRMIP